MRNKNFNFMRRRHLPINNWNKLKKLLNERIGRMKINPKMNSWLNTTQMSRQSRLWTQSSLTSRDKNIYHPCLGSSLKTSAAARAPAWATKRMMNKSPTSTTSQQMTRTTRQTYLTKLSSVTAKTCLRTNTSSQGSSRVGSSTVSSVLCVKVKSNVSDQG